MIGGEKKVSGGARGVLEEEDWSHIIQMLRKYSLNLALWRYSIGVKVKIFGVNVYHPYTTRHFFKSTVSNFSNSHQFLRKT